MISTHKVEWFSRISESVTYIRDVYANLLFIEVNGMRASFPGFIIGLVYGCKQISMLLPFQFAIGIFLYFSQCQLTRSREEGIVICVKDYHPSKGYSSIFIT